MTVDMWLLLLTLTILANILKLSDKRTDYYIGPVALVNKYRMSTNICWQPADSFGATWLRKCLRPYVYILSRAANSYKCNNKLSLWWCSRKFAKS
jgi:hypothetical protein